MVLNYIWVAFFLIALVVGLVRLIFFGDTVIFTNLVNSTFDMSKAGFEIALGLTGVLTLWMGLMKIGELGGAIGILAKVARPFFQRLFPEVPRDHPAHGSIIMNFAANMLGLDNAATPLGLKAMQELQELNPQPDTGTNAQIMFLVLNTSWLTVIPISIMVYRAQRGRPIRRTSSADSAGDLHQLPRRTGHRGTRAAPQALRPRRHGVPARPDAADRRHDLVLRRAAAGAGAGDLQPGGQPDPVRRDLLIHHTRRR
jgi:spore maturation protein SpmA